MASVTSYFNSTLWHKSMHRFWPLWAVYFVGWLFLIPLRLLSSYFDYLSWLDRIDRIVEIVEDIPYMLQAGVWFSAGYGLLCAMAVFGYLYNNRSAAMMHALPMRRESLFFTQYAAGVSYFLLPHLAISVLSLAVCLIILPSGNMDVAVRSVGTWFLVQTGTALFFFSFAAFCAMFTGHVLALPAFYGILNILVYVIYALITQLMQEFFYGFVSNYDSSDVLMYFTPVYALSEACDWNTIYADTPNALGEYPIIGQSLESPGTVAAYAVVGVIFAVLALMVYRTRHIESAGDVVSVRLVRPIFRLGVAFCAGLSFGTATTVFFGWLDSTPLFIACVLFWTVVGWFAAEMLLQKSFRVLRAWKGCAVMLAAMAVLCFAFTNDWFGIEDRVPSANEVSQLYVSTNLGAPYDDGNYLQLTLTDPEEMQTFIDLHQAIIREKHRAPSSSSYTIAEPADGYGSLRLTYTLANGSVLERRYHSVPVFKDEVALENSVTWRFSQLFQNRDLAAYAYGFATYDQYRPVSGWLNNVYDMELEGHVELTFDTASTEDLNRLWQAIKADFEEGNLGVRYLFEDEARYENTYVTDLYVSFTDADNRTRHFGITMSLNAKHTLAWLEEMEIMGERYVFVEHDMEEYYPEYYYKYYDDDYYGEASAEVVAGVY